MKDIVSNTIKKLNLPKRRALQLVAAAIENSWKNGLRPSISLSKLGNRHERINFDGYLKDSMAQLFMQHENVICELIRTARDLLHQGRQINGDFWRMRLEDWLEESLEKGRFSDEWALALLCDSMAGPIIENQMTEEYARHFSSRHFVGKLQNLPPWERLTQQEQLNEQAKNWREAEEEYLAKRRAAFILTGQELCSTQVA